jgi:hypothetical protein
MLVTMLVILKKKNFPLPLGAESFFSSTLLTLSALAQHNNRVGRSLTVPNASMNIIKKTAAYTFVFAIIVYIEAVIFFV